MKSFKKLFSKSSGAQIHAKELPNKEGKMADSPSSPAGDHNPTESVSTPRSSLPALKEDAPLELGSQEIETRRAQHRPGSDVDGSPEYIGLSLNPGSVEFLRPRDPRASSGLGFEHSGSLNQRLAQLTMLDEPQFTRSVPELSSIPGGRPGPRAANPPPIQPSPSFQIDPDDPSSMTQEELNQLSEDLRSGTLPAQKEAALKIRHSCKTSDTCRKQIADVDCIPPLTLLVESEDKEMAEHAVTALLNLFILKDNRLDIAKQAIEPLIHAMKSDVKPVAENAAAAIFMLSLEDENKMEIGSSGAIDPLVQILRSGTPTGKSDSCKALFNLSILSANKWRIVDAGGVDVLMEILEDPESKLAERSVSIMANLATIPEGRNAIANFEDGISLLGEVLEGGTQIGKENSAAALLQLAKHDPAHKQIIINEGLSPSLVALSQNGTPRAREKAEALLNQFREKK